MAALPKKPARYSIGIPGSSSIPLYQAGIPFFTGIFIPGRYSEYRAGIVEYRAGY